MKKEHIGMGVLWGGFLSFIIYFFKIGENYSRAWQMGVSCYVIGSIFCIWSLIGKGDVMKLWEKIKEANKLECGENCESCQYKMVCPTGRHKTKQKINRRLLVGAVFYTIIIPSIGLIWGYDGLTWKTFIFILWNVFLGLFVGGLHYWQYIIPKIVKKYSISGTYCDSDGCIPLDGDNVTIRVGEIEVRK
jgi:hypothetical protein